MVIEGKLVVRDWDPNGITAVMIDGEDLHDLIDEWCKEMWPEQWRKGRWGTGHYGYVRITVEAT